MVMVKNYIIRWIYKLIYFFSYQLMLKEILHFIKCALFDFKIKWYFDIQFEAYIKWWNT
jgi:hypothetical protein